MRDFFENLTGHKPYYYQEVTIPKYLLNKKDIFLCAPTGAGKTWAALVPFLWFKKQGIDFRDRLIYVLPLRTLATTLYTETVECCNRVFKVKNHPEDRVYEKQELVITIQTGEQKNDPFFEGDIIFTTVDQCLSSYINMPVSIPTRVGNINAGALLGSLIVFDEFHLLEPDKAMSTAIEMLKRLKPFSGFLIMTATFTGRGLELLRDLLDGNIVKLTHDEVLALPSHKDKKRTYKWINRPLNVDDILCRHKGKRSIVICNTVSRAQNIFAELQERLKDSSTTIFLLHSRFYHEDRKNTENQLKEWFGKNANRTDIILVTTQVIEAGIDISADNLHSELAPFNSIVQRAGRCARYEGNRSVGTVWIYELETDKKGNIKTGPYRDSIQTVFLKNTRIILEQLPTEGEVLDFTGELRLLDRVHTEQESSYLESFVQRESATRETVHEAMDGCHDTAVRDLIRDVSSVNVILCDNPYSLRFDKKKWPRMISVPRSSLYSLSPFFEEAGGFGETVAWYPVEDSNILDDESIFSFGWKTVSANEELSNISWLIVINPQYASYSSALGLQIGVAGDRREPEYFERPPVLRYSIKFETYADHIQNVITECRKMSRIYQVSAKALSNYYKIEVESLEKLIEIACVLHDVGKLSVKWQESARKWQKHKNPKKLTEEPLAHTDYDPERDFEEKKKFPKLPPHASEGAYAVSEMLKNELGNECEYEYYIAIWTAIARHHGAFSKTLNDFSLIKDAALWAMESADINYNEKVILTDRPDNVSKNQFKNDFLLCFSKNICDVKLWPLYAFLVRRLRLADQRSQRGGKV